MIAEAQAPEVNGASGHEGNRPVPAQRPEGNGAKPRVNGANGADRATTNGTDPLQFLNDLAA